MELLQFERIEAMPKDLCFHIQSKICTRMIVEVHLKFPSFFIFLPIICVDIYIVIGKCETNSISANLRYETEI